MSGTENTRQSFELLQKYNRSRPALSRLLDDAHRYERFSARLDGLLMDYSRVALDDSARNVLLGIAEASGLPERRDHLFAGEHINNTEDRPVLHHLWRSREFPGPLSHEEGAQCVAGLERMRDIAGALHAGESPGRPDEPVRHVIHIGIGGSLLGPRLLCRAFPGPDTAPRVHFLSSVDALERERLLERIDPAETVVVLVSKSFTTSEVMAHGRRVLEWQGAHLDEEARGSRLFAVTADPSRAVAFGVPESHVLPMGEWTGGRFSLWSPVGLSAAITMGPDGFDRLCAGGARMDRHFRNAPAAENLPVLHGLISCWHRNMCGLGSQVLAPYDSRLADLPGWLQQVSMESNGKSVDREGEAVTLQTAPVVLGECGTDAQHALFQAFHQGTQAVPLEFIGVIQADHEDRAAQDLLLSHMLAQATALAIGRDAETVRAEMESRGEPPDRVAARTPHRVMPGDRPSIVFLLDRLDPETVGALLVLYEHSVFVQSVVWNINAFDQWGVELGKELCDRIVPALGGRSEPRDDLASVAGLVSEIRQRSGRS